MIPATLAASLGFMLPVATAPNTIVYGSGLIKVKDMYRIGFWVNIVGIVLIAFMCYFFSSDIFKY
jgi:sodium-dependent dicarboxylate transporter 2/3/5